MKFKADDSIAAPKDLVWVEFADFSAIETAARKRGATLNRVGQWVEPYQGAEWRGELPVRGRAKPVSAKITRFEAPNNYLVKSEIGGMSTSFEIALTEITAESTQVNIVLELRASSLTARLLLQTAKLARSRILRRLETYIARHGNAAEAEHRFRSIANH